MIQVKESLFYLSNLLETTYGIKSSPEMFRKAKKNDYSVFQNMKNLLFHMLLKKYDLDLHVPINDFLDSNNENQQTQQLMDNFTAISISLMYPNFTLLLKDKIHILFGGPRRILMILVWMLMSNPSFFHLMDDKLKQDILDMSSKDDIPNIADPAEYNPEDDLKSKIKTTIFQHNNKNKRELYQGLHELSELRLVLEKKICKVNGMLKLRDKKIKMLQKKTSLGDTKILKLLKNSEKYETLLRQKELKLKEVVKLIDGLGHRKNICEWLGNTRIEEKNQTPRYVALQDIEDSEIAEKIAEDLLNSSEIKISTVFTKVVKAISQMKKMVPVVKKFQNFWAQVCEELGQNKEFQKQSKKVISMVGRDLNERFPSFEVGAKERSGNYQIDTLSVLIDMMDPKKSLKNTIPSPQKEERIEKKDGKQSTDDKESRVERHYKDMIDTQDQEVKTILQNWQGFKEEFKYFLKDQSIGMIDSTLNV